MAVENHCLIEDQLYSGSSVKLSEGDGKKWNSFSNMDPAMLLKVTMRTYGDFGHVSLHKILEFGIPRPPKIDEDLIVPIVGNVVLVGFLILNDLMSAPV